MICAYPRVNGTFCCENDLKNEWGFDGFVTSDFGAVHSTVPSAMAGLDLEMPTGRRRCPCSGGHRLPTRLHAVPAAPGPRTRSGAGVRELLDDPLHLLRGDIAEVGGDGPAMAIGVGHGSVAVAPERREGRMSRMMDPKPQGYLE